MFLNRGKQTAPLALRAGVEHYHVRHDRVVVMSIETLPVPRVAATDRVAVDDLGYADDGISHVAARFGYMQTPDVLATLRMLDPATTEGQLDLDQDQASYFLSKIELRIGPGPRMARWRKRLFSATSYVTADAAEHFGLPPTAPSSWAHTSRFSRLCVLGWLTAAWARGCKDTSVTDSDVRDLRERAAEGDQDAVDQLVELAGERGDMDELRRLADAGSNDAVAQLVELAGERGDIEELRRLAGAGVRDATDQLVELATERGDMAELRRLADSGNRDAADVLGEFAEGHDDGQ